MNIEIAVQVLTLLITKKYSRSTQTAHLDLNNLYKLKSSILFFIYIQPLCKIKLPYKEPNIMFALISKRDLILITTNKHYCLLLIAINLIELPKTQRIMTIDVKL